MTEDPRKREKPLILEIVVESQALKGERNPESNRNRDRDDRAPG